MKNPGLLDPGKFELIIEFMIKLFNQMTAREALYFFEKFLWNKMKKTAEAVFINFNLID